MINEKVKKFLNKFGSKNPNKLFKSKNKREQLLLEVFNLHDGIVPNIPSTSVEFQEAFLEWESLITDNQMFWVLLPVFWSAQSSSEGWEYIFDKYARMKIPLRTRSELAMTLSMRDSDVSKKLFKQVIFNSKSSKITLYRGFCAHEKKNIRSSDDKYQQLEGNGFSYSINKITATLLSRVTDSPRFFTKYAGISVSQLLKTTIGSHIEQVQRLFMNNYISCIGTYEVERKDILFYTNVLDELEVVVHPKKIKLINYEILKPQEYFAVHHMFNLFEKFELEKEISKINILNSLEIYNKVRNKIYKMLKDSKISVEEELSKILNYEGTTIDKLLSKYNFSKLNNLNEFIIV